MISESSIQYNKRKRTSVIDGNMTKMAVRIKSDIMNGITPLNVEESGVSFAIEFMTKRFIPTGGVIKPTSTTMSTSIPNQSANSSLPSPKSSADTMGKKIGMVSKIIDRESITHPRIK